MVRKSLLVCLLILTLGVIATGCGDQSQAPAEPGAAPEPAPEQVRIGVVQFAEHPSLDQARQGFLDSLSEAGYIEGQNLQVDYQNAQGDVATCSTIANKFVGDQADLILAIATPAAQAAAEATKDIPILITAVTDPVVAGLVEGLENPGTNVTGTSDMNPVDLQLGLVKEIVPDAENVGIIYNSSEDNSTVQVEMAREAVADLGLNIVEAVATNTAEVQQAAQSLVGKVDAIYVPTDNTVVAALDAVVQVAEQNDIPLIVGEGDSVRKGGLATVGIDYYTLGRQTGDIAIRILEEGVTPQDIPVEYQKEYKTVVNLTAAENMGVTLPQSLLDRAEQVKAE